MKRIVVLTLLLPVAAFWAALALPGTGHATPWNELVVFGDSLSDMGNAYTLSSGLFPPSPPYAQRFSNGPVAAEYLAQRLGVPLAPSTVPGGTDFAVGGATTGVGNYNFTINSPAGLQSIPAMQNTGIAAQIAAFTGGGFAFDPARTLFMVWGGPNDIRLALATGADPGAAAGQAVQNLFLDVYALALSGATHFLVPDLPDLGKTPEAIAAGPAAEAGLEALSVGFNMGLAAAMAQVASLVGADVTVFDTFGEMNRILSDPGAFGFSNTTTPCVDTPALATGCQGYLFFDSVHPTTAGHAILGEAFAAAVPEPATMVLLLAGGMLLVLVRRGPKVLG